MSAEIDLVLAAEAAAVEVQRLWPDESLAERINCLAEEVGEVSRASTKRRHAVAVGSFKGLTPDEWTSNLRVELAQVILVALTIAHREQFDMRTALVEQIGALQMMPTPTQLNGRTVTQSEGES